MASSMLDEANEVLIPLSDADGNRNIIQKVVKEFVPVKIIESQVYSIIIEIYSENGTFQDNLTKYYEIEREKVKKSINEAESICISTTSWRHHDRKNFLSLTAHYIDNNTELQAHMLECYQYSDNCTAENIQTEIKMICDRWNITNKIFIVVNDNNSNIVTEAINLLNFEKIPCLTHTIWLILQTTCKDFHETLSQHQNSSQYQQDSDKKRWENYNWSVVLGPNFGNNLLELKLFDRQLSYWEKDVRDNSSLFEMLLFFNQLVASEKGTSLSQGLVMFYCLEKICLDLLSKELSPSSWTKRIAEKLSDELKKGFNNIEKKDFLAVTTLLDPRFNKKGFMNESAWTTACCSLKLEVKRMVNETEAAAEDVPPPPKRPRGVWDYFEEEIVKKYSQEKCTEVDKFLVEPLLPRQECPIRWWRDNKDTYPHLYKIAKRRLCIPATPVLTNDVFDKFIKNVKFDGYELDIKIINQLLFLNHNI